MPDPTAPASDAELRPLVERALSAHYDVERELGRGGMGIVYQARDRRLKRTVAIKVLPPELGFRAEIRSRFLREAETAAQLNHPNIVPIYAVDEREGVVYFVMACVAGVTLARALADGAREGDRLPADDARRVLAEVADALAYAHARGVVHRDIKPDNILLDGETGRALVTDFGIARAVQESGDTRLTATGMALGTPAFMSPEQALGERALDGRSDLYSLGVVGYLMLAGALPFTAASTPSMLLKHVSETPEPLGERCPEVPADLAGAVMMLLEKEPEHRFASAAALARALRGEGGAFVAPRPAESPPTRGGAGNAATPRVTGDAAAPVGSAGASRAAVRAARRAARTGGDAAAAPALAVESDVARELALRWEAEPVRHFRRRLGYFVAVNSVILIGTLFGSRDFTSITLLWSIYLAFRYAKLWERGYDWRDVLRQPRDRRLGDVLSEWADDVRHAARRIVRGHGAGMPSQGAVGRRAATGSVPAAAPPAAALPRGDGARGHRTDLVARGRADREEIARQVRSLPRRDRAVVGDVLPAADALLDRMQELARGLAVLDRTDDRGALARVDGEIARLEAAANPLEAGSEGRVRQLAALKRERLALLAAGARREEAEARLAVCALALQNVRLDVLRLRAGQVVEAAGWITQLTERARAVARDVDAAVPDEGAAVRAGASARPTDSRAP